jgi:hypothetical protein
MSELEHVAAAVLSRMILPKGPITLDANEQFVIATWLWKLAIVHEHPSGATYFNDAERRCLVNDDSPPASGVHVWIAAYRGDLDANLRGGPCKFASR